MVRARLVVFPVKGRIWCFTRSIDSSLSLSSLQTSSSSSTPSTLRDLWKSLSFKSQPVGANVELLVDFVSDKMNKAWNGLEKAPERSLKNKIYGVGLWLLSRVRPSEIFLKSISKEVTGIEVTYPTSLNPRLVRWRLRHIAMSGAIIHKKYLYGSATLLPVSTVFMVLPLPNIPFFWLLFRTYSHWRALQGSEKLLQLVSDGSISTGPHLRKAKKDHDSSQPGVQETTESPWVLRPCKELEELIRRGSPHDGLSKCVIKDICKTFELSPQDALKYQKL